MLRYNTSFIHKNFNKFIKKYKVLEFKSKILIAVSGGQDSLCLLKLLKDEQIKHKWIIYIIHFNHGWRHDSKQNADFIAKLARKWKFFF
uniref:tRNA(Ile)-lysidine synthase n=1 Tax=Madagascaria erythrocladioides TaxID=753684 RepID=UPI001FCCD794|nr:tRNA(Ile)-lysidine synthase [Madagascaria erythrocladioides]UNJ16501.1 tRNA(Ile)-lysidine synthase [Madagascaria erythrocladioides]